MIIFGIKSLTLRDIEKIIFNNEPVSVAESAKENIAANFEFLKEFSHNKLIYGINTGFGPMAQYRIDATNLRQLQYNLIRSHCSGSGQLLDEASTLSLMICRLNSLLGGYSGIHPEVIDLLESMINKRILPCIYEHGSVGASGDLVQLAHLALSLIGEGKVRYGGDYRNSLEVFEETGLKPIDIHIREGLAILNGTSTMTGIGLYNILQSKKILDWSVSMSSLINEIVEAYDDHLSAELNHVKKHKGQQVIAGRMRAFIDDSGLIRKRHDHLYNRHIEEDVLKDKVQEYYSLRCVPQVLGPVYDTICYSEEVLVNELNSVNDNPIIDHKNQNIYHGGNFHGDYVAIEMDKLKTAVTKLSMLSERQLNYMLNDKLNQKFPPFLNAGVLGLNFGMQGIQFAATSTVAENQTLSFPMYVHSIPNNNDNQDIVSMGTNAANICKKVIDNTFEVLAIQWVALIQAIDIADVSDRLSTKGKELYVSLRNHMAFFKEDEVKYERLHAITSYMKQNTPGLLEGQDPV